MSVPNVSPAEAAKRLREGDALLLDVREPHEVDLAAVEGALHVPMREIPSRLAEVPRDRDVLVICHHGMRSLQVAHFLQRQGHSRVFNVRGGIDAWAREVDPTVGAY